MIRLYKIIGYIRDFNYRRGAHFAWAVFAELYKNDQFKNAWKDIGAKEHINGLEIIRKKLQNVEFYVEDRKGMKIEKIYIDMDGVLADFERGVRDFCGISTEDDERMWAAVKNVEHFYYKLKPIQGSIEMMKSLIDKYGDKCEILSAVPKERRGIIHAEEDKKEWINKYLGDDLVINLVHDWTEKIPFCTGEGCVLVDDRYENIRGWREAGGTGIIFYNASDAHDEVLELESYKEVISMFGPLSGKFVINDERAMNILKLYCFL